MKIEARLFNPRGELVAEFTRAEVAILALPALVRAAGQALHLTVLSTVPVQSLPPLPRGCWRDWFDPVNARAIVCRPRA